MTRRSPTLEGFRAIFNRPSLTLAEMSWRWSFWAAGGFLLSALVIEYLDTLPVGARDLLFLNSGQPTLIGRALGHIFRGSSVRLLLGTIVVIASLAIAWTLISAIGRSATLRAIREYFADRDETLSMGDSQVQAQNRPLISIAGLNILRLSVGLAASIAAIGAFTTSTLVSTHKTPNPVLAFGLSVLLFSAVVLAWLVLNWTLSFSSVFVVRDHSDSFGALASAARFSRERPWGLWTVNFWFGLAHLVLFFIATTAASMVIGLAQVFPGLLILLLLVILTLLYAAAADSIHVGRFAAWYYLVATPLFSETESMPVSEAINATVTPLVRTEPAAPVQFPPEDDILSDIDARDSSSAASSQGPEV